MRRKTLRTMPVVLAALLAGAAGPASADTGEKAEPGTDEVLIPAGVFLMGGEGDGDDAPAHEVSLDAFYLDRYEVTNAQYEAFCEATGRALPIFWGSDQFRCGPKYPDHPVVGVSYYDARSYAEWAGKRLPTEAEWEYAARGGTEGKPYVSGEELTPADANYARSDTGGPVVVGSYAPNAFGLSDMCGNVLEWVFDFYDPDYYATSPARNPQGTEAGKFRVLRGGGWHTGPGCCRVSYRNALVSGWLDFNVGFRCARDAE